jgi:hypothetical protein
VAFETIFEESMVESKNQLPSDAIPSEGVVRSMTAIERRRVLLKAIGGGTVASAAVALPLKAAASDSILVCKSPTTGQLIMCSVSGMQSAIGSRTLTQVQVCGYSPGYWGKLNDKLCVCGPTGSGEWGPNMARTCPSPYTWTTTVKSVLTFSTLSSSLTLGMLMADGNGSCSKPDKSTVSYGNYSNTEEVHWMCAIFNALTFPGKYPYTATKIRNVANGTDTSIDRANLLLLIKSLEGVGGY